MLHSLEIKNYRNLRHLVIPKLGRVNLVIGKNNTGKSSLLEALSIYYAYDGIEFFTWIDNLLNIREGSIKDPLKYQENVKAFSNLFNNNHYDEFDENTAIKIGEVDDENSLKLRLVRTILYLDRSYKVAKSENEIDGKPEEIELLAIKNENNFQALGVLNGQFHRRVMHEFQTPVFELIPAYTPSNFSSNALFWDRIVKDKNADDKEEMVINALKIINKDIKKLNFIASDLKPDNKRVPIVRTGTNSIPLRSMGDGINRVLSIMLALVNCENGYLLIDEFENGLHYSVQEKLWEIIFQLADQLNIQVFATTHSNDTIKAFESIVNSNESYKDSQLIKLINVDGDIKQETADAEDLEIIVDGNIDPR